MEKIDDPFWDFSQQLPCGENSFKYSLNVVCSHLENPFMNARILKMDVGYVSGSMSLHRGSPVLTPVDN